MEPLSKENTRRFKGIAEAVLFAAGDAVELRALCQILGLEADAVKTLMYSLGEDYADKSRGLRLVQVGDSWQISTKPEYYEYISRITNRQEPTGLSRAALETLSIIAYRQPITRVDIDNLRGVSSNSSVQKLLDRGLIKEAGRLEAPGRPILYKTTPVFLKTVGITTLEELPSFDQFAFGEQQLMDLQKPEDEERAE
ncbi:MAG: SMC-Scp complex subunit ScpB [Eubacterium sp.]|nr:SMC-Scp complex subunit ScpB [Eubacterium sp.]